MSDDERPRKSWKEIDRQRDRSAHRKEERREGERTGKGPRREKSYRAALDRLFETGKIAELVEQKAPGSGESKEHGESRIRMLAQIRNAPDPESLTRAVDAFLAQFDALPDDLELLGRVLEHRSIDRKIEAMERIDKLLDRERPKRTRAMLGLLKMIRDVGDDPEAVDLATRLIERLE
jgi:hypothetical protein